MFTRFHRLLVSGALCLLGTLAVPAALAQAVYEFNMSQQSLADALRAIARQTVTNILFEPTAVENVMAPAVRGQLSASEAINRVLVGTNLTAQQTAANTMLVRPVSREATTSDGTRASRSALDSQAAPLGWLNRIRLAQADTAQSDPPADSDSSSRDNNAAPALEEIIVTAQKRSESASKVPISISVYDQAAMDRQGIRSLEDVASITPGVSYYSFAFANDLSIRGVSSRAGLPTTGMYLDDLPIGERLGVVGAGSAPLQIFDLERVEVLRGPQGTLFGAGAQAGVVRFITPQPSLTQYSGYSRADLSTTEGDIGYEAGAAFGGPIIQDRLGFRVSASYRRDAGYVDHESSIPGGVNRGDSNWSNTKVARAALSFAPTDYLTITPSVLYQKFYRADLSGFDPAVANTDAGQFVDPHLLRHPQNDEFYLSALKAELDLAKVSVTSITSYFDRNRSSTIDYTTVIPALFGGPEPTSADQAVPTDYYGVQETLAQEIRVQSTDPTARLQWTIGGYFSNAEQVASQYLTMLSFPQFVEDVFGAPIETVFGSGLLEGRYMYKADLEFNDRQRAGFGQLSYRVFDDLSLIAGVRIARQHNDFRFVTRGPLVSGGASSQGAQDETVVTPKFGVNYQLNDNNLFYLSVAKGTRMGGANQPLPLEDRAECQDQLQQLGAGGTPETFETDSLWSYEIGSKNRLFSNRLQIDASIFHMVWTDIQQRVSVPACASEFTGNLAEAESDGFDLAVTALITDQLKLGMAVGYSDAKLTQGVGTGSVVYALEGDQIADNPPWNVTASAEYRFRLGGVNEAYVRVDNTYRSRNSGPFSDQHPQVLSYNPFFTVDSSTNELNLRAGVGWKGVDVSAYARNILNAAPLFLVNRHPVDTAGRAYTLTPRTMGITAVYRW